MNAEAAAGENARERTPPEANRSRFWWVPKPLVITFLGAAATAWLAPAFTRQWQDRQKEREIKVALVSDIGDSTSDALVTSQYVASQAFPDGQAEYNRLSLDWARRSAQIEAKLEAYFPGESLVDDWRKYSLVVQSGFYLLTDSGIGKAQATERVRQYVESAGSASNPASQVDWRRLRSLDFGEPKAVDDYVFVSEQLLDDKKRLIRAILNAQAEGFSTTGRDLLHDLAPFA